MDYLAATRYLISLGNEVRASASDAVNVAKLGLENITALLADLGNPQNSYPGVLIAGTNGKGSVAAMLDAILRSSAARLASTGERFVTGLYTSPHLVEIAERIQVDGAAIPPDDFADLFDFLRTRIEKMLADGTLRFHPTFFECLTAMSMEYFRRSKCSLAVFEVGMGGRLDATNTTTPLVSVITEIDFDHERFLGNTIAAIAAEKAGIVKPGGAVVSTASHPDAKRVIAETAARQGARLIEPSKEYVIESLSNNAGLYSFVVRHTDGSALPVRLALRGKHQVPNSLAAISTARELAEMGFPIVNEDIANGLATAKWPGRLELIHESPCVFLDGAHNPSGARALLDFWREHWAQRRVFLVYGAMRDKAVPEIAEILFPRAHTVILTRPGQERAAQPETVRSLAGHLNSRLLCEDDPQKALEIALSLAAAEDIIVVTGSLFLVGDIKDSLLARQWLTHNDGAGHTLHAARVK